MLGREGLKNPSWFALANSPENTEGTGHWLSNRILVSDAVRLDRNRRTGRIRTTGIKDTNAGKLIH